MEKFLIDRSDYPLGPWSGELDHYEWVDQATGYQCVIRRNMAGALCGYVGLPEEHPMYKVHYNNINVRVHGGLTFSDFDGGDGLWYVGFDCAHYRDIIPRLLVYSPDLFDKDTVYRNWRYVTNEVTGLAKQLAKMNSLIGRIKFLWSKINDH